MLIKGWHILGAFAFVMTLPMGCGDPEAEGRPTREWRLLFNGKDLAGWDTWLGPPQGGPMPIGLNKDPQRVYSVTTEDGEPAIRITGEIWGGLVTREEFGNYHFRAEFKWGTKVWSIQDAGLMYHSTGPYGGAVHGGVSGQFMSSLEMQLALWDFGSFAAIGAEITADSQRRHDATAPDKVGHRSRWHKIELYCAGETCVQLVDGKVTAIVTRPRKRVDGQDVPLTHGKIQLQSEGCEVFWRKAEIRPIREIPEEYLR